LWQRYGETGSPAARNELMLLYRPLVMAVVRRLPREVRAHWSDADLESFGTFGLLDAIERWEPSARFETYAYTRIRGAIYDELRRLDWLPRRVRRHVVSYNRAADDITAQLGRTPLRAEVLDAACIDEPSERAAAIAGVATAQLLHHDRGVVGAGSEESELVNLDPSLEPEHHVETVSDRLQLQRAIAELNPRQRAVVSLHLVAGLSQRQVASLIGVTESRVCQIVKQALGRLRELMTVPDELEQRAV
jgi:RNA polymerase sigma factor for flagellar operon FliA